MSTYYDHADARGLDVRRLAAAHKADRARMLATLAERELGCITITMSAAELRARLAEARFCGAVGQLDRVLRRICA